MRKILNLKPIIDARFRAYWNGWQAITTMLREDAHKNTFESGWRYAVAESIELDYRFAFFAFCAGVVVGVIIVLIN